MARAPILHLQDRLPSWPGRPSSSSRTGYHRGLGGLPPAPGQVTSVAWAAYP
ncbi:MAG: hypothetical protein LBT40_15680 [Deltaproteobacteria bacterium]|nr:hypothetical protein [Deltaproteobacteria bacterium]